MREDEEIDTDKKEAGGKRNDESLLKRIKKHNLSTGEEHQRVQAVAEAYHRTKGYNNQRYQVQDSIPYGRGKFYVVTYYGENHNFYVGFVYDDGTRRCYYSELRALMYAHAPPKPNMGSNILIGAVAVVVVMIAAALSWKVAYGSINDAALAAIIAVVSGVTGAAAMWLKRQV
jgi:hypothetical protein